MIITKAAIDAALADDRTQPIDQFRAARDHIFRSILDDAAHDKNYDAAHAERRVTSLFGPSPGDVAEAIEKLRTARMLYQPSAGKSSRTTLTKAAASAVDWSKIGFRTPTFRRLRKLLESAANERDFDIREAEREIHQLYDHSPEEIADGIMRVRAARLLFVG